MHKIGGGGGGGGGGTANTHIQGFFFSQCLHRKHNHNSRTKWNDDDDELMLNVLRCHLTY